MPKVTESYISNKKDAIIQSARLVFQEKPLSQITMRDIISKTDFSQGGIYRYYSSVDEIFLEAINQATPTVEIDLSINQLIESDRSLADSISDSIRSIGEYIKELQDTLGGKMLFSLLVMYAFDSEKKKTVVEKLIFHQTLNKAQLNIIVYIQDNINNGRLKPTVPFNNLLKFTQSAIDGIANDAAILSMENNEETYITEQFEILAKTILYFLGLEQ
jgi:AcrR family transcriptional regulator